MNVQEQVVKNTLERIKKADPRMYSLILRTYKPKQQLAGIGGLFDDFSSAFNNAMNTATQVYVNREQAKIAQEQAKVIAQQEAEKARLQLEAMRIQSADMFTQQQAASQQMDLQRYMAEIASSDQNKLLFGAAGLLTLVLAAMVMTRKKGR